MLDDFAVFILTHGRANNVVTYKTLEKQGYTGKIYIVIDNEDSQAEEYRQKFRNVLMFDKKAVAKTFDTMDTEENRKTIVYARNACFDLAKQVGVRFFLELDDDYTSFEIREEKNGKLKARNIKRLDDVFQAMIDFLVDSGADTVAFAQGGDLIGGKDGGMYKQRIKRKAMNTFFCDVEKRFDFVGRINEDVNTYTRYGNVGWLGITVVDCVVNQKQTQKNDGGMSEVYRDNGTYLKSFYSVMGRPDCVKIGMMGNCYYRMHHKIDWDLCVPKILNEAHKKR